MQASTAAAHGVADGGDGIVLTDDALVQFLLQMEQFFALALHHAADGDARPATDHLGDVVGSHLLTHQLRLLLRIQLLLNGGNVCLQLLHLAVANLGHLSVVALALGAFSLIFQLLHLLLVLLNLVHQLALAFPASTELRLLILQLGNLFVELRNLRLVVLALDGFALNLELSQSAADLVELLRHAIALHAQLGGCLIHQVDGLVGQETLGDVALRELHGGDAGIVLDTHLVMVLVAFLQSAKDRDG